MGKKSRRQRERRDKLRTDYVSGERIWVKDSFGMFPEGIYTFVDNKAGLIGLRAEDAMIGIADVALQHSRRLRDEEKDLPGVSSREIAAHNLALSSSLGEPDCLHCKELVGDLH